MYIALGIVLIFAAIGLFFYGRKKAKKDESKTVEYAFSLLALIAGVLLAILPNSGKTNEGPTGETTTTAGMDITVNGGINVSGRNNVIVSGNNNSIYPAPTTTDSIVELVDVFIDEELDEYNFSIALDIKLRNIGDKIAFLNKLEVIMLDYYEMQTLGDYHYEEESSYEYDLLIDNRSLQTFEISQAIPANDVDRFRLALAAANGIEGYPVICYFYLKLYFNSNDYVQSEKMIVPIMVPRIVVASTYKENMPNAKANYLALCRFNEYDAKKSDTFLRCLESYEDTKSDFMEYDEKESDANTYLRLLEGYEDSQSDFMD